ncbi:hypothetical protein M9Y10_019838 [Tritrichomonas musculus]|uniref:Uncharacterized protein n=1 Tax=Tritrichomonas musculus TaxID=1915356 RepID=A0ABR2HHD9_9EUKA
MSTDQRNENFHQDPEQQTALLNEDNFLNSISNLKKYYENSLKWLQEIEELKKNIQRLNELNDEKEKKIRNLEQDIKELKEKLSLQTINDMDTNTKNNLESNQLKRSNKPPQRRSYSRKYNNLKKTKPKSN